MDRNVLADRLESVLNRLHASGTPLEEQGSLREQLVDVYLSLLQEVEADDGALTVDEAYFFSLPQYPAYRRFLDKDLLDFITLGSSYTMPGGLSCSPGDVEELRERLEQLR